MSECVSAAGYRVPVIVPQAQRTPRNYRPKWQLVFALLPFAFQFKDSICMLEIVR